MTLNAGEHMRTDGADTPRLAARPAHGGDLGLAHRLFPDAAAPWIDLSTGINPHPYPLPVLPADVWTRLPGAADLEALRTAARSAYRVLDALSIMAAPGTQILIETLPLLAPTDARVAVLGPTYQEHARSWRQAGFTVDEVRELDDIGDARIVVVVNPNNPDGRIVPPARLAALGAKLAARGGWLVVDEAFADFTPEASLVPLAPAGTIVLRSFGKTYGLAGIRLGFAIGDSATIASLEDHLGPWCVSGPALAIGATALADRAWLAEAKAARRADADRLDALLATVGQVVGGTTLYRLLETRQAPALFTHLGSNGLFVRRFADHPHRLRFGLPPDEPAWQQLTAALRDAGGPCASGEA